MRYTFDIAFVVNVDGSVHALRTVDFDGVRYGSGGVVSLPMESIGCDFEADAVMDGDLAISVFYPANEPQHDAPKGEVGQQAGEAEAPAQGADGQSAQGQVGMDGQAVAP